jgi:hypothetical protein
MDKVQKHNLFKYNNVVEEFYEHRRKTTACILKKTGNKSSFVLGITVIIFKEHLKQDYREIKTESHK